MASGLAQLPKTALPKIKPEKIIGLISDTHVPNRARAIPKSVFEAFENVDFIIHAGDLIEMTVIDELEQIAPVLAVHGNMDCQEVRASIPEINSLKIMDWKIGVTHDPGVAFGMDKMREIMENNFFNVLVYGHTHAHSIRWEGRNLYINPGSPTSPEPPFLCKPTVGLLRVSKEAIIPEILQV